jgi:DNA-directed RNA polymerase subunit alpha
MEGAALSELNLVLPKVETEAAIDDYGRFIISPLERGYGVTLGTSLRRMLISSLPGAAITAVRVNGVHHEFSDIPNIQEDMTTLILNLRQLRFKLTEKEPARLHLTVKGKGEVTAADLETPEYLQIANPDLHLLTAKNKDADLDVELRVEVGTGYSPAEERDGLPADEIAIDALFSPVRKANFKVERARVGQATDYDRLVLEVTTDGTITPHEALRHAATLTVKHFALIAETDVELLQEPDPEEEAEEIAVLDIPIEELELSVRTYNSLKRAGITLVSEVIEKLKRGPNEILSIRNFGQKSSDELIDRLQEKSYLDEVDPTIIESIRAGGR